MERKNYIQGLIYGISAFLIWGLLPFYWKMVSSISPYQIFVQRVVWSFLFIIIIISLKGELASFIKLIRNKINWIPILLPAISVSINWLVYIWAINNGYVIESSLGYYINPLVLTVFGAFFYKERLNRLQKIGITFAASGVLVKSLLYGHFPFISITLAFSFATYGLLKKRSPLNSLKGLGFETLIIGLPSIVYLLFVETKGLGITGNLPWHFWLLIAFSGVVTAIPLLFYAESTKRLPLSVVGFLQYIAPTIMLLLGVFVFGEKFDNSSIISFSMIWVGLGFFSYSQYLLLKK